MFSNKIVDNLKNSSGIRAMFEQGAKLSKQFGADKVFDFSLGNPDPEPPEKVLTTLKNLINSDIPKLHSYMPNAGYTDVREKIADNIKKETGLPMTYEQIVMTVGAGGGLNAVFKALLNPGEEVIAFAPYFVEYGFYADNYGGKLVVIPANTNNFQPDPEALAKSITEKTKIIILNTPNNPTGVVYSKETLEKLSEVVSTKEKEFGNVIFIVSDEPYRTLIYDNIELPSLLNIFKNSIRVDSFSKSLSLPGERIGYVAVNPGIAENDLLMNAIIFCNRTLGYVNAPSLFQKVIAETLDTTVDIKIYEERRDILYNNLISFGFDCVKPQGAFYLFPKSPIADDGEFVKSALKYNLVIVPGKSFGCPGYFRIAYCASLKTIQNSLPAFEKLAKEYNLK